MFRCQRELLIKSWREGGFVFVKYFTQFSWGRICSQHCKNESSWHQKVPSNTFSNGDKLAAAVLQIGATLKSKQTKNMLAVTSFPGPTFLFATLILKCLIFETNYKIRVFPVTNWNWWDVEGAPIKNCDICRRLKSCERPLQPPEI